jgi:hypothetical protein
VFSVRLMQISEIRRGRRKAEFVTELELAFVLRAVEMGLSILR